MKRIIEATYPIDFRAEDARRLGEALAHHDSVVAIGMKRVGISNFLRFFLNHDAIEKTYIKNGVPHVFVLVDLNDLVERDIPPFWTLLLTRLVDTVQRTDLAETVKRECRRLFVQSIQLKDQFFTLDSVQKVLAHFLSSGLYPTIFLVRFDRLADAATAEFFNNLQGLKEAAHQKLSYVFTSYRPLYDLAPQVFSKSFLSVFSRDLYLAPAIPRDMKVILETLKERYHTTFKESLSDALIDVSGGHVQYLHLAILRLTHETSLPKDQKELVALLSSDEQMQLSSEELFESLTKAEKEALLTINRGEMVDENLRQTAAYLWNTGMVTNMGGRSVIFSPLFAGYLGKVTTAVAGNGEFTKKEHLLFTFLKAHEGQLCEREAIIEAVWPENKEFGVSDWAIDRLVARVRGKLKHQGNTYEIITVKTRGYKLISK
ncbi:MAG: helix-turn-helix domain-containing protein [Patescibacteria group bacterium]